MNDVLYIIVCLGTEFFFGVCATIVGIVLIDDCQTKLDNNDGKKET